MADAIPTSVEGWCPFSGCSNPVGENTITGKVGDVTITTRVCDDHFKWLSQGTVDALSLSAVIRNSSGATSHS